MQDAVAGTHLVDQVAAAHPHDPQSLGGRRLPTAPRRARRHPRHRLRSTQHQEQGIHPGHKRWTVERTYGWLMFRRCLARGYEPLPARSEAVIHLGPSTAWTSPRTPPRPPRPRHPCAVPPRAR
ncbi:transposase [Streptomyces sp. NPDC052015]|uniref:transposase n=1 Tax=Streptomyces sp. NPDC052015 TaxID=3154755 RepID=UPI0034451E67